MATDRPQPVTPLPTPIRVLIKGASTVVWASWMGGPRADFTFPRVVEAELLAHGRPAEVRCSGLPAELTRIGLANWEREVVPFSPDVVVLHYGHMETVHLFMPRWLERHANDEGARTGPVRSRYREHVLEPVWKRLCQVQSVLDKTLPWSIVSHPRRIRRSTNDLELLIGKVRRVGSPLVLVPNLLPTGPPYRKWFPGMDTRVGVVNASIAALIDRLDEPDVRVFRVDEVAATVVPPGEEPQPDGGHYTFPLHRAVGETMARVIMDWADTQPHLKRP